MNAFAIICFGGAGLLGVTAIVFQIQDIVREYGNTTGGEMLYGALWNLAAVLCAAGSFAFLPWYLSIAVFPAVVASSFLLRDVVERIGIRWTD